MGCGVARGEEAQGRAAQVGAVGDTRTLGRRTEGGRRLCLVSRGCGTLRVGYPGDPGGPGSSRALPESRTSTERKATLRPVTGCKRVTLRHDPPPWHWVKPGYSVRPPPSCTETSTTDYRSPHYPPFPRGEFPRRQDFYQNSSSFGFMALASKSFSF